ncbi:hypothetical protein HMPREF1555_00177 [Porphyromonas gingivalis F0570]|uniref:Uncharacterized protein n=1 Tax=Porphyromonas gingivalis F0570 TaxID=1227271 RepID=A0A0E2LT08_PORGN|nr:hypothetical protein HMPREF1555_00177 [Porphyromonas gingivalis F0570]
MQWYDRHGWGKIGLMKKGMMYESCVHIRCYLVVNCLSIMFYIKQISFSFEELHPLGGCFVGRQI